VSCRRAWTDVLGTKRRAELAGVLASYATGCRWFRGKARTIKHTAIVDVIRTSEEDAIVMLDVEYELGATETYVMPIAFIADGGADAARAQGVIAAISVFEAGDDGRGVRGALVDAVQCDRFSALLLRTMSDRAVFAGDKGKVAGVPFAPLAELPPATDLTHRTLNAEQSNSAIVFGERFMLKLFRVLAEGPSAEYELGQFLSNAAFRGVAQLAGVLDYRVAGREPGTLGTLLEFVPNQGDAWRLTLNSLDRYFDRLLSEEQRPEAPRVAERPLLTRALEPPSERSIDWIGPYLDRARLLGVRTADLHRVLASSSDPLFAPQPFDMHQQSLYQAASGMMARTFERLRGRRDALGPEIAEVASRVLASEQALDQALARITKRKLDAMRIRIHGDFHLGQALWTGSDFVIVDLEGEPTRPLSQRRFKRCPLRDVAGMLRSFHYAGEAALRHGRLRTEDTVLLGPWARAWPAWVSASYLGGYLDALRGSSLLPASPADIATLIDFYLLEKCIYEIGYELDNRPDWIVIPLCGVLELVDVGR
jgi:maltose alpha-D-glucosyltransferase/alpha-amylase